MAFLGLSLGLLASCTGPGTAAPATAVPLEDGTGLTVTIDRVLNGTLTISPAIESGKAYAKGTVLTLSAAPANGYVLDSLYHAVEGHYGPQYHESMVPRTTVTLDAPTTLGAAFLPAADLDGLSVTQDVIYATPGVKPLKYDVFSPEGASDLPLVVIVHGGGWSSNDENIMRGMAREIARTGRYVAASIDYRWIGTLDGDSTETEVQDLICDVYGALAHIQEHAATYGADPTRIFITGDSAGGHLSASAATMVERIGSGGFGNGTWEYRPTYLPPGQNAEQVQAKLAAAIKAVAPSYGVFSPEHLSRFSTEGPEVLTAIAPLDNIPAVTARPVPHFMVRGSSDPLITHEAVASYAAALTAAGQTVEHVEVEGANHAFYDWKPDAVTRQTFKRYGVPHIAAMLAFFDRYQ